MTEHAVGTARGILRNSAAMFLVGIFAKGMGLIVAVLVARFLGPSATGLYALLFGIAVLCETLTTLGVPEAIFAEAGLSFLGIGINPPIPSWGQMVGESVSTIRFYWHLALFPAVMIGLTMLGFVLLGDGLRDILHPRTKT